MQANIYLQLLGKVQLRIWSNPFFLPITENSCMSRITPFNEDLYRHLVQKVGSLSFLFSDNKAPLIDSRIAEKLFERATNGRSIARTDEAFDVIAGSQFDIGVGVKTFIYKYLNKCYLSDETKSSI